MYFVLDKLAQCICLHLITDTHSTLIRIFDRIVKVIEAKKDCAQF